VVSPCSPRFIRAVFPNKAASEMVCVGILREGLRPADRRSLRSVLASWLNGRRTFRNDAVFLSRVPSCLLHLLLRDSQMHAHQSPTKAWQAYCNGRWALDRILTSLPLLLHPPVGRLNLLGVQLPVFLGHSQRSGR